MFLDDVFFQVIKKYSLRLQSSLYGEIKRYKSPVRIRIFIITFKFFTT